MCKRGLLDNSIYNDALKALVAKAFCLGVIEDRLRDKTLESSLGYPRFLDGLRQCLGDVCIT
jgi:hypothetical protein